MSTKIEVDIDDKTLALLGVVQNYYTTAPPPPSTAPPATAQEAVIIRERFAPTGGAVDLARYDPAIPDPRPLAERDGWYLWTTAGGAAYLCRCGQTDIYRYGGGRWLLMPLAGYPGWWSEAEPDETVVPTVFNGEISLTRSEPGERDPGRRDTFGART
jgi:hypothetical protein